MSALPMAVRLVTGRFAKDQGCYQIRGMFSKGDSIMSDRGFNVQDVFATKDVKVNIPSFVKGKSQLSEAEVRKDRSIASIRIHVECLIGLPKTFKILRKEFPGQRIVLGDYIITVCFYLTNFKECIMHCYGERRSSPHDHIIISDILNTYLVCNGFNANRSYVCICTGTLNSIY